VGKNNRSVYVRSGIEGDPLCFSDSLRSCATVPPYKTGDSNSSSPSYGRHSPVFLGIPQFAIREKIDLFLTMGIFGQFMRPCKIFSLPESYSSLRVDGDFASGWTASGTSFPRHFKLAKVALALRRIYAIRGNIDL
jgi:hypothetical protein